MGRRGRAAIAIGVAAALATAVARADQPASAAGRLWALGSDDAAWLVHTDDQRDPRTGLPTVRLFYSGRAHPDGAAAYWRRLNPLVGRLATAIADRDGLLLRFDDGAIVRVTPLGSAPVSRPPDGATIRAWCGDTAATGAFAIVQIEPAAGDASSASRPLLPTDEDKPTAAADAATAPASRPALTPGAWLFRFNGADWSPVSGVPLPAQIGGLWLAARDGRVLAIWNEPRARTGGGEAGRTDEVGVVGNRLRSIEWSDDEWKSPQTITDDAHAVLPRPGWTPEGPLLLVGRPQDGDTNRVRLTPFRRGAPGWIAGESMRLAEEPVELSADTAVGFAQQRWIVARIAEGDRIEFGFAPPADQPVLTWARINNPPSGPAARPWTSWVSTGALFVMLALLVFLRPERVTGGPALPADFVLAPPSWRILAGCLDLLPALVATAYWWMPLMLEAQEKIQLYPAGDAEGLRIVAELAARAQLLVISAYAGFCFACEAALGTTPAKRLLGMRVFDEQGRPPRMLQIVLRNLLRVAELGTTWVAFFSLFVMLVLSPRRQRLGDLIARTIVGAFGAAGGPGAPADPAAPQRDAAPRDTDSPARGDDQDGAPRT